MRSKKGKKYLKIVYYKNSRRFGRAKFRNFKYFIVTSIEIENQNKV